jgi:hypothetical protein
VCARRLDSLCWDKRVHGIPSLQRGWWRPGSVHVWPSERSCGGRRRTDWEQSRHVLDAGVGGQQSYLRLPRRSVLFGVDVYGIAELP